MFIEVILFGPLFTLAERMFNLRLKEELERKSGGKVQVVLPQERAVQYISEQGINFDRLFKGCLDDAVRYTAAIANLDGTDADSGTCIEIGYRKGDDKDAYVLGFRTDFRTSEDGGLNAMLRLCDEVFYYTDPFCTMENLATQLLEKLYARFQCIRD